MSGWDQYVVTLPTPEIMISTGPYSLYVAGDAVFFGQRGETMLVRKLDPNEVQLFNNLAIVNDR